MSRIGIPRALLYWQYLPMWQSFFEALGSEVVVSPPTTRAVFAAGASRVVAETCMPVKIFCGHILSLKGQCDFVFVPAIRSMEPRVYNCSKFLALPDLVKAVCPDAPPLLEVEIDVNQGRRELYQSLYRFARPFTWNPLKVKGAVQEAMEAHRQYIHRMHTQKQTPPQVLEGEEGRGVGVEEKGSKVSLALLGHPYLLYDDFLNQRMLAKLKGMGAKVFTPEMVPPEAQEAAIAQLDGKSYWTYEGEVVGAGGYYMEGEVDGVIGIGAFGCGPDSLMMDLVRRYARQKHKPFLNLTLDEHSGEAGLLTRLEAFVDMLERRKRVR